MPIFNKMKVFVDDDQRLIEGVIAVVETYHNMYENFRDSKDIILLNSVKYGEFCYYPAEKMIFPSPNNIASPDILGDSNDNNRKLTNSEKFNYDFVSVLNYICKENFTNKRAIWGVTDWSAKIKFILADQFTIRGDSQSPCWEAEITPPDGKECVVSYKLFPDVADVLDFMADKGLVLKSEDISNIDNVKDSLSLFGIYRRYNKGKSNPTGQKWFDCAIMTPAYIYKNSLFQNRYDTISTYVESDNKKRHSATVDPETVSRIKEFYSACIGRILKELGEYPTGDGEEKRKLLYIAGIIESIKNPMNNTGLIEVLKSDIIKEALRCGYADETEFENNVKSCTLPPRPAVRDENKRAIIIQMFNMILYTIACNYYVQYIEARFPNENNDEKIDRYIKYFPNVFFVKPDLCVNDKARTLIDIIAFCTDYNIFNSSSYDVICGELEGLYDYITKKPERFTYYKEAEDIWNAMSALGGKEEKEYKNQLIAAGDARIRRLLELKRYLGSEDYERLKKRLKYADYERAKLPNLSDRDIMNPAANNWEAYRFVAAENDVYSLALTNTTGGNLYYSEPAINEIGEISIDFGTRNTVLMKRNAHGEQVVPVLINGESEHPTMIEFNNVIRFCKSYTEDTFRPLTNLGDIDFAHDAKKHYTNNIKNNSVNGFFFEIKQWAKQRSDFSKWIDNSGNEFSFVHSKTEINGEVCNIDPIEVYFYYLGLHINSPANGIYTNYIVSYPVTFGYDVIKVMIDSMKRGLERSMPRDCKITINIVSGNEQKGRDNQYYEPTAFAKCAIKRYCFIPGNNVEAVNYAIFDMGGGTTDFDFGIYTSKEGERIKRMSIGGEGNQSLGGELLLNKMALTVVMQNAKSFLDNSVHFLSNDINYKSDFVNIDGISFTDDEINKIIIMPSHEANNIERGNMLILCDILRAFWENNDTSKTDISVTFRSSAPENPIANIRISIDYETIRKVISRCIRGTFKVFLKLIEEAFGSDTVYIILSGNSCKSKLVLDVITEGIEEKKASGKEYILLPLLTRDYSAFTNDVITAIRNMNPEKSCIDENLLRNFEHNTPYTCKTGVAIGLLDSGIISDDYEENERCDYYIGKPVPHYFYLIKDENGEGHLKKNTWYRYCDATILRTGAIDQNLYYTNNIMVLGADDNNPFFRDGNTTVKNCKFQFNDKDTEELKKRYNLERKKTDTPKLKLYIRPVEHNEIEYMLVEDFCNSVFEKLNKNLDKNPEIAKVYKGKPFCKGKSRIKLV